MPIASGSTLVTPDFDEPWDGWNPRGAAHDRGLRRKQSIVAAAAAVVHALLDRSGTSRRQSTSAERRVYVVQRPIQFNAFEFAVLAALRAGQLSRGCTPRVITGSEKITVTAQLEVAAGKIVREPMAAIVAL
jgi:DNA-directed RNA polymerase subunit K/omega